MFRCRVNLLDDTCIERDLEKNAVGKVLFDQVCNHLNLLERGYFGLATWDSSNNKVWLDFSREVHKQIIGHDATFTFNVKFYPPDPSLLAEDLTRYLLCLQVRMDIMMSHLPCPSDMLAMLGSYTVQSEFGDYDPYIHVPGYLSNIPLTPNQTPELEERVAELHRTYKSMTPAQADENFLQIAMILPLYGVDLHPAKNVSGADVMLGVSAEELMVYEGKIKTQGFPWPRVLKISYIRNKFHLRIRHTEESILESTINFILPSYRACKRLWKVAVEHHAFFRNHRQDKYEGLLQLGSRFRFRRNTHTETIQASSNIKRPGPPVAHTTIKKKAKESMLQALKSPTRMELDDWFQVFKFDRSRPTSVPETTYTYQETLVSTQADTKILRHKEKKKVISANEEEGDDDIPEEEQEWFQLLGTRSFPKKVSLFSESEKLECALPQFWKHNSDDWLVLLYPKSSETSLWEVAPIPLSFESPQSEKQKEEKIKWEKTTSEDRIKFVTIRKDVQFVSEGPEESQKIIEEKLEGEGDGERSQKVIINKKTTQETFNQESQEIFVEQRVRKVEIVAKVEEVMIEVSEDKIKALEKVLLEVETIGQRLQDVEDLKLRLQEVKMLEQKLQQVEQENLQGERDDWYVLLDHKPLVSSAGLIEILKQREAIRQLEEEPVQKVSPIQIKDVWHILLDLLPRTQWSTNLPRAPSVEEIIKTPVAPVAVEERRWEEERRLREERRRSSQIAIPYTSPVDRGVLPDTDEKDDWFNLLDSSPKESVLGRVMELYEDTREEKVQLVEEQMSFIKIEMPFEMIPRSPGELQESDRWFLLLDPIPFKKRSIPLDTLERNMKEEEAWRIKDEERRRQLEQKIIRMEEERKIQKEPVFVEVKEVQLVPQREDVVQKDSYDDWFIILDKSPTVLAAGIYEDRVGLRTQQRVVVVSEQLTIRKKEVIIEEKPAVITEMKVKTEEVEKKIPVVMRDVDDSWFVLFDPAPFVQRSVPMEVADSWVLEERKLREGQERRIRDEERRKRETEERRARIAMQSEEEPEEEGEDWFILLQPDSKVNKRAEEERRRKEEEWEKQVMAESKTKGVTILEEGAAWLHFKNDWFLILDASLKGIDIKPPALLPSPVISPVPVPKPHSEPKPQPEPKPRPELKSRPESKPHPELKSRLMPTFDQPLTSTPTTKPVPLTRPTYQEKTPRRQDITQESEVEMESELIRKRMMKKTEGESIYVRHSLLMLEDLDVSQEVVLKHHASISELKRIFMEDMPVSGPTEWDKRLLTHSPVKIPQITNGQFRVLIDTVETETVIVTKVEEEEMSTM